MAAIRTFPTSDADLLGWLNNFNTILTAAPATYGLTSAQMTAFAAKVTAFQAALNACEPGVRTKSATSTKNDAKKSVKKAATDLANIITGQPNVTDAQRLALGLNVRATPQPIPRPSSQPAIEILSVMGKTVTVRFKSTETIGKRGRPAGTVGLQVYSLIAPEASGNPADWKFEATTSKNLVTIEFPEATAPGTQVWITGSWVSPRLETGPGANPVTTHLQFGNTIVALPQQTRKRRAA